MLVPRLCLHWEIITEKCLVYFLEKKQALVYYLDMYKYIEIT